MAITSINKFKFYRDLATILGAQAASALIGLATVKISVTLYPASQYGTASLVTGLFNLVRSFGLLPFFQYFLMYYWNNENKIALRNQATGATILGSLTALPMVGLWLFFIKADRLHIPWVLMLVVGLAVIESIKMVRLQEIHLHQEHAHFGILIFFDALARPICIFLFHFFFGSSYFTLIGGNLVGSSVILPYLLSSPKGKVSIRLLFHTMRFNVRCLIQSHWKFLLPIACLGATSWITGLGDRFFLAQGMGVASAGYYAAIYGLFSLPFLIFTNGITLVIRPKLNLAMIGPNPTSYAKQFYRFLPLYLSGLIFLAFLLAAIHNPLIKLLLRQEYSIALPAFPGILIGQIFASMSIYFEMHFYLHKRSDMVLAKSAFGALVAVIAIPLMVATWGYRGIGWANSVYFGCDFGLALALSFFAKLK